MFNEKNYEKTKSSKRPGGLYRKQPDLLIALLSVSKDWTTPCPIVFGGMGAYVYDIYLKLLGQVAS